MTYIVARRHQIYQLLRLIVSPRKDSSYLRSVLLQKNIFGSWYKGLYFPVQKLFGVSLSERGVCLFVHSPTLNSGIQSQSRRPRRCSEPLATRFSAFRHQKRDKCRSTIRGCMMSHLPKSPPSLEKKTMQVCCRCQKKVSGGEMAVAKRLESLLRKIGAKSHWYDCCAMSKMYACCID